MKNYFLIACLSLITFTLASCVTSHRGKSLAVLRDELDKAEPWRHTLPEEGTSFSRPTFPKVKTSKLKNGLTIMVVEDKRLPIASVTLATKNGSARDQLGMSGLMYLTGLMLKEGTKNKTSLELAEEFANLGTEASINVGKDMSTMTAAVLSDKVPAVVGLFAEMAKTPRFSEEDFYRVKLQHQGMLASQQGVLSYVAQINFLMTAYGEKHPYAYPSAGTIPSVTKLNINDIKNSHKNHFGPEISALIVVGDVSLEQIAKVAKKHFGDWHQKAESLSKISDPPVQKRMHTRLVARGNAAQTYLLLGQPLMTQKDHDLATLEVLQNIIAGMPTSRLDNKLREEKGWTYGVNCAVSPLLGKGPFMVATSIQLPYATDALGEILREFDKLRKEPVSEVELSTAKNGLLNSFLARYSTVSRVANNVVEQFVYSLPENHYETIYDKISRVSAKDILAMANRTLKQENIVAIAVGDLDAMEAPMAKAGLGTISIEKEEGPQTPQMAR